MSTGCSTALWPEPGTVGGATDALDRAAEVEDNGEEKWIVSRIRSAKEIAKSRAAF